MFHIIPETKAHKGKCDRCYPDLTTLYKSSAGLSKNIVNWVMTLLKLDDETLKAKGYERAPGRNPPVKQINYTLEGREEKIHWPFKYPEFLPLISKFKPNWYEELWGKYGTPKE